MRVRAVDRGPREASDGGHAGSVAQRAR
jgi:hypothetical protein